MATKKKQQKGKNQTFDVLTAYETFPFESGFTRFEISIDDVPLIPVCKVKLDLKTNIL